MSDARPTELGRQLAVMPVFCAHQSTKFAVYINDVAVDGRREAQHEYRRGPSPAAPLQPPRRPNLDRSLGDHTERAAIDTEFMVYFAMIVDTPILFALFQGAQLGFSGPLSELRDPGTRTANMWI